MTFQKQLQLPEFKRGMHQITSLINDGIASFSGLPEKGLVNIFLLHTSAALTITENYDPDVPVDLNSCLDKIAPDSVSLYRHSDEGADDMPAHIKSSILGVSLTIPFSDKKLVLGTWQGVFLCEFRNRPSRRKIVLTVTG
jgi:secondary thiamine-phosphate synthase enzyme